MTDNDVRRIEDKVDNVHLILAELKGSLSPSLERLTEGQNDLEQQIAGIKKDEDTRHEDHEKRLRALERFRFSVPSLAVLGLLLDVALVVYYVTHT